MSHRTGAPNQRGGDTGGSSTAYPYSSRAPAPNTADSSYTSSPPASSYASSPPASSYASSTPASSYASSPPASAYPYPQQAAGYVAYQYGSQPLPGSTPSYPPQAPPAAHPQDLASQYYAQPTATAYQQPGVPQYTQSTSFPPSPPSTGDDPPFTLVPSQDIYYQRQSRHAQQAAQHPQQLAYGWPERFDGQSAWTASDLVGPNNQASWFYGLTQFDRDSLKDALRRFLESGVDMVYISPTYFQVGEPLGSKLREIGSRIYNERGFFLLRGLDLDSYNDRERVIIHAGISSYIGSQRAYQCGDYQVVYHIKDRSRPGVMETDLAPTATPNQIGFHTDIGDIISNLTVHPAASGGTSYFASATQVYNELASTRKDIINLLAQHWQFDIFPNIQADKPSTYRPLLYNAGTHATLLCFRRPFTTAAPHNVRQGNFSPITPAQKEALDAIHYTALKSAFAIRFERGDISFTNNLKVLHSREAFQDHPSLPRRQVQRLIVRDPDESYKLPAGLEDIWRKIFGDPKLAWKHETFPDENTIGEACWRLNG